MSAHSLSESDDKSEPLSTLLTEGTVVEVKVGDRWYNSVIRRVREQETGETIISVRSCVKVSNKGTKEWKNARVSIDNGEDYSSKFCVPQSIYPSDLVQCGNIVWVWSLSKRQWRSAVITRFRDGRWIRLRDLCNRTKMKLKLFTAQQCREWICRSQENILLDCLMACFDHMNECLAQLIAQFAGMECSVPMFAGTKVRSEMSIIPHNLLFSTGILLIPARKLYSTGLSMGLTLGSAFLTCTLGLVALPEVPFNRRLREKHRITVDKLGMEHWKWESFDNLKPDVFGYGLPASQNRGRMSVKWMDGRIKLSKDHAYMISVSVSDGVFVDAFRSREVFGHSERFSVGDCFSFVMPCVINKAGVLQFETWPRSKCGCTPKRMDFMPEIYLDIQ